MKAVIFEQLGGPEVINVVDVPVQNPGPGQVRVRMKASGINFSDLMIRTGDYPDTFEMPYRVGREIAGTIDAVGEGADSWSVGDRVFGLIVEGGTMAELPVVSAKALFPLPEGLSFVEAAAAPLQGLTAIQTIEEVGKVQAGETVLIHAAAGGVGGLAVQIAFARGARVIGTTSRDDKLDSIRELGADAVNYSKDGWVEHVLDLTDGRGVDAVLESIGGAVFEQSWQRVTAHGARIVLIGAASGSVPLDTLTILASHRSLIGYNLATYFPDHAAEVGAALQRLLALVGEGKVKLRVGHTIPIERAPEAFALMEERRNVGKIVVIP